MTFSDPLAEFRERAVKAAAARCILIEEGDDKASADTELSGNRATSSGDRTPEEDKSGSIRERIASIVRRTYPEARRIASNLPEAASCATFNPDELEDPRDLAGTDVAIVRGAFGVVENGAVWIPRAFRHKAMLFIPEALVILLDRKQIVCNMHEAYAREDFDTYDFGSFIAGPSKTADIEQALVIGAHGARDVTIILL
ncbi:MAG TPA: LUD domain-containing protein [Candidatus Coprenecus stercorigallinarum]|nr:LUD domain-containing protein [Candidatus Coprenecus stercorigallinarum]